MNIVKHALLLALFIVLSSQAQASNYKCGVQKGHGLSSQGELKKTNFTDLYVGTEFVVDRATGKVIGKLSNANSYGRPEVLDAGSSAQSFKALTVYQPRTMVAYLQVQEYVEGPNKPFMFLDGNNIFTGLCTVY